jgi:hypothetical protein
MNLQWVAISDEWVVLLRPGQYQCAHCRLVYNKVNDERWSDEKAKAEHDAMFPHQSLETAVVICDDCFKEFAAWWEKKIATN